MPGDTETGFTAARRKSERGDDVYAGRVARSVAVMERDERHGMSAAAVGNAIARAALRRHPAPLYSVGVKYKLFALLARVLPGTLVNRIVGLLYAR
jgi:hypothetical protein